MFCGEGDFEKSSHSIGRQKGVIIQRSIISNLPEKEAHNRLWNAWRTSKSESDLFVKVDADTVLTHENVLSDVWNVFQNDKSVTGLQAPLLDRFTGEFINGLNCFHPKVTFNDTIDELFCDRQVDVGHDRIIKANDVPTSLKPAGLHCHYATDIQAFHFGVHRALKKQTTILDRVRVKFLEERDELRAWVLLGSEEVKNGEFGEHDGFNYGDVYFAERFMLQKLFFNVNEVYERHAR